MKHKRITKLVLIDIKYKFNDGTYTGVADGYGPTYTCKFSKRCTSTGNNKVNSIIAC